MEKVRENCGKEGKGDEITIAHAIYRARRALLKTSRETAEDIGDKWTGKFREERRNEFI